MKKIITYFLATLSAMNSFAQTFEGKIIYKETLKGKVSNVKNKYFATINSFSKEHFMKNGNYKTIFKDGLIEWELYLKKENKLYTKFYNSDTLYWKDGTKTTYENLKIEINKGVANVLNYKCDEVIFTLSNSVCKFYYNSNLLIDKKLFGNQKLNHWYNFVSKPNLLPLKSIVEYGEMFGSSIIESVAIEIKKMKLNKEIFELPSNITIMANPY